MSEPLFNYIDLAAIILVIIGAFIGYCRKLSGEIAILLSVGAAFFIGIFFFEPLGNWLIFNTKLDAGGARIATYVFLVLAAGVVLVVLRILLGKMMNIVIGERADRIWGVIAGAIRSLLLVFIVFFAMTILPYENINRKFGEESFIGRILLKFSPKLKEIIKEKVDNPLINV